MDGWNEEETGFLEPPCHICPQYGFDLFDANAWTWYAWNVLDRTGRSHTMGNDYLREESIHSYLERYRRNTPEVYEKILAIEERMLPYRLEKADRQREVERKSSLKG